MNDQWTGYKINQLHRQAKMREAENYRLSQVAGEKKNPAAHRLADIFAGLFALIS